jgi:glycosyltransferase involved in cell wall biosynthesis
MALTHLHRLKPDVEIILFGSGSIKAETLGFPATLLKVVPTIHDLAELYANADLGMVFSTTNPSLVPYEMMSSGCPVVDLNRPGNEYNYDNRRDIAFLADPEPEKMAAEVARLLDDRDELARRRAESLAFSATFPTEHEMAKRVEFLILNRMRQRGFV